MPAGSEVDVRPITGAELDELLPLIAGYQAFYGAQADDERNRRFFAKFLHPSTAGLLIGAWRDGILVGFATLYWSFSSISAGDSVLMNDLFVRADARGAGIGRMLIKRGVDEARARGAVQLEWYTGQDNLTAQRLYDSVSGADRSAWFGYAIDVEGK